MAIVKPPDSVRPSKIRGSGYSKFFKAVLAGPADGCNRFSLSAISLRPGGHTPRESFPGGRAYHVLSGEVTLIDGDGMIHNLARGHTVFLQPWEEFHLRNDSEDTTELLLASETR
ncbi:cupin domain-containing protein [Candidatus Fermentibacteria bacterium]|nr:cupin domain-containing protein [Candidatus Fermentibacteria bacterium]